MFLSLCRLLEFIIFVQKLHFMDFKPQYYKTHPLSLVVKIESVFDRNGEIRYAVTMSNGTKENIHYLFKHLSSAIDFLESNFK